ncbi:phosphoenolpyruvate carboxylase, partial [uncultured Synechococcus sp.]
MRQTLPSSDILMGRRTLRQLAERLELVEDLWRTVLRSECPPDQAERLLKLKQLCDEEETSKEIIRLIVEMDLAEAIAAARAFSLYFQLVNILEQHIEEDRYLATMAHGEEDNDPLENP